MNDLNKIAEAAALVSLARDNIPSDVQELLVRGDPARNIPPNALRRAIGNGVGEAARAYKSEHMD